MAKELAFTQHLGSKEDSIGSTYLVARREWDERYGGLIKRAQQWRGAAVLALLVALVEAVVIIGVATRPEPLRTWWRLILSAGWPRRGLSIGLPQSMSV